MFSKKISCGSKIPHPSHNVSNGPSLRPVKRATCTDFVVKSGTTLYFPPQLFHTCNILICYKTSLMVGGKTPNIVIQLVWQNKLRVLFPVLLYLKTNLFGSKWRGETSLPHKFYLVIHEHSRYLQPSCCKTGLNMGDITLRCRFSIHLATCTFLLPVLYRSFNQLNV